MEEGGGGSTWEKDRLGQNIYLIWASVFVLNIAGRPRIGL